MGNIVNRDHSSLGRRFDDLLGGPGGQIVRRILSSSDPGPAKALIATVNGSQFLHAILLRDASAVERLFIDGEYLVSKTRELKECELDALMSGIVEVRDFDRALRRYKESEYLRLGCRDLADIADVTEIMAELSDLAGACVRSALNFHAARLAEKHGVPKAGSGEIAALGLGKISGRELNFSSDIDLVFIRPDGEGLTPGPRPIPVAQYCERLVRSVAASLSDVTEDGFVFRTDLRLRPEGTRGELVPSFSNALEYYLYLGRTWERAAWMRAAPIAGNPQLGESFLNALSPFVYRRHLDYSTLEDMREMKARIQNSLKRKPGVNIKLGQGGIREIEFVVQALQLINGGRNPAIRSCGTVESLRLFRKFGLLTEETAEALESAYLFFRKVEHRIQINHQVQTHELPTTPEDQHELALRMGYASTEAGRFYEELDRRRNLVESVFAGLFYGVPEESVAQCPSQVKSLIGSLAEEDKAIRLLEKMGHGDPNELLALIKDLVNPSVKRFPDDKARRRIERLAPLLLSEALQQPQPAKALAALHDYLRALAGAAGYLSTLAENPPSAKFLVGLLGESRFFAELLIRHPQTLDSLIGRWTVRHSETKDALAAELHERLLYCRSYEEELDVLRIFKNEEILLVGASHLQGEIDSRAARRRITTVAEVCLAAATHIGAREMERKFGPIAVDCTEQLTLLGMGKLGGEEMTYLSDVDVIFVYQDPGTPPAGMTAHEWFTRLAHRIISILNVPTSEGIVFAIDTRLRPSGQKGPLVSSLDAFREYHARTSKLWEKQALIKARPVCGRPETQREVASIVRDCVLRTRVSHQDIAEIDRLRRRMERELAYEDERHVDLKTGHGGMVDVEFFVQANILANVADHPEALHHNTLTALAALGEAGLVDPAVRSDLESGYGFLANLEDRLRIMEHRSVDRLPLEGEKLEQLARRLGYPPGRQLDLVADYLETTAKIRAAYNSFFKSDAFDDDRAAGPDPGKRPSPRAPLSDDDRIGGKIPEVTGHGRDQKK
jgi:glutamate-ammonia-ligase adenylyltransferase